MAPKTNSWLCFIKRKIYIFFTNACTCDNLVLALTLSVCKKTRVVRQISMLQNTVFSVMF